MTTKQSIILGFHYHLPVGAPENIFEEVYLSKLKPFFQILYEYPRVPFVLHLSGTLLHRIERKYGEVFMLISDMVQRKQVELISGGFYEPMMPLLLAPDRAGQIELLTTYLRRHFGKRSYGCWIPAIAWEQPLVQSIARTGHQYTFVDEKTLIAAGFSEARYNFPCISEDKGETILVYPIFSSLRDQILEQGMAPALREFLNRQEGRPFLRTIFPDLFAKQTGINAFFEDLTQFTDTICLTLPSKMQKADAALQRVYFPGNNCKQYLIDYPEAAMVYAKMMKTRAHIEKLKGDKARRKSAQEELWKAQDVSLFCMEHQYNYHTAPPDTYPGIYSPTLRNAVYSTMLEAERIIREEGRWESALTILDFDFDGINEYLFQNERMNCFVREKGASLFELDYLPKRWNYQNTITLTPVENSTIPREIESTFFDILAPPDWDIEKGSFDEVRELGSEIFTSNDVDRVHKNASFSVPAKKGPFGIFAVTKNYKLTEKFITVQYKIMNTGTERQSCLFVTKVNLSFPSDNEKALRVFSYKQYASFSANSEKTTIQAEDETSLSAVTALDFQDLRNEAIINISSNQAFDARLSKIRKTYRNPLGRLDDVYQWTRVRAYKQLSLDAGASVDFFFRLGIYD